MNNTTMETTYIQTSVHVKGFVTLVREFFELCKQYRDEAKVPINPNRDGFYTRYNKKVTPFIKEASLFYNGLFSVLSMKYSNSEHEELLLAYGTKIILSYNNKDGLIFILRSKDIPKKQGVVLAYLVKQGYNVTRGETTNYLGRIKLYLNF